MSNKKIEPVVLVEDVIEEVLEEEVAAEVAPPVSEPAVTKAGVYVAVEGDSYASLAEKLDRGSLTKFEFAKWLYDLNGGKSISEGSEVKF